MSTRIFKAGATSQSIQIFIADSTSTVGPLGLAALTPGAPGAAVPTFYYARNKGAAVSFGNLATISGGVTGAWTSGGFIELDATHLKGLYRLDIPDAAIASGATEVTLYLYGATNMVPTIINIRLTAFDLDTANPTVGGYASGQDPLTLLMAGTLGAAPTITVRQWYESLLAGFASRRTPSDLGDGTVSLVSKDRAGTAKITQVVTKADGSITSNPTVA